MKYSQTQQEIISSLAKGKEIKQIEGKSYIDGKHYRSTSIEGLMRRGALSKDADKYYLTEQGKARAGAISSVVENLVDHRPNRLEFRWFDHHFIATFDIGQCDYDWWDRARRGAVAGLSIAGLFIKPIASKKAAWVLGELPQFRFDHKKTQELVGEWFRENHADILLAMEESAVMGDYYIVVNPDETVTIVPPNVVEPIVDENNFSRQIGWRIKQSFSHPQRPWLVQTITDEYYLNERVITISTPNGNQKTERFKNLTGLLPVFHIPNNRRGGETFGHPEAESLVQILHSYGEIISVAMEGNIRQGRPTPVFEKLGSQDNLNAFIEAFGRRETRKLDNGSTEEYIVIEFSSDQVVYLGEDGSFKYASPGMFTADTMNILQILFYLVIQHTEMPEFIWGGAIASSKASAEVQMPPFTKWVEKEQGRAEKWLIPLASYVAALKALNSPRNARYTAGTKPAVKWMPLTTKDEKLTLEAIKIALTLGKWKPEWVVPYMPLDIDNPEEIIAGIIAQAEEAARIANGDNEPFDADTPDDFNRDLAQDEERQQESVIETIVKEAHTGVMVAFEMPITEAAALAASARQAGVEPIAPEDMHITLAYIGQMDEIADKRKALERVIKKFATSHTELGGSIGGVGRFNASENSDGFDVLYASFDAPMLPDFRQALVKAIEGTGVEISRAHGFVPHVTLAYVPKGSDMPNLALETSSVQFGKVSLYWGDERVDFELKKELEAEIA